MNAFELATSRYLSRVSSFTISDLISVFPWFGLNEKWLEEVVMFWVNNGLIKKEGNHYVPINTSIERTILFLDVDGVLNHKKSTDAIDDICLQNLKKICDGRNMIIILISSWKSGWNKDKNQKQDDDAKYLDKRLSEYGLSIYDKSSKYPGSRMLEVLDWVMKLNADKYIILDDDWHHYRNTPLMIKLVPTDYYSGGLTEELTRYAISLLE